MGQLLKKVNKSWLLVLAGGLLPGVAYFPLPVSWLMFVGFVPVLILLDSNRPPWKKYLLIWAVFFLWYHTVLFTSAFLLMELPAKIFLMTFFYGFYAFLMLIPVMVYDVSTRKIKSRAKLLLLPVCWSLYEYLLNRSELGLPALTMASAFGNFPLLLGTMTIGGAFIYVFFVWVGNILLYQSIKYHGEQSFPRYRNALILFIGGFLLINIALYFLPADRTGSEKKVAIVQPDFTNGPDITSREASGRMNVLRQLTRGVSRPVDLVVWPESAIQGFIMNIDSLDRNEVITYIRQIAMEKKAPILAGSILYKLYPSESVATVTARPANDGSGRFYDVCNGALLIPPDTLTSVQVYTKQKLVPFIERMPYIHLLPFTEAFKIKVGNYYPSFTVLPNAPYLRYHDMKILPLVCSESTFAEYPLESCRAGANLMVTIANEGWTNKAVTSAIYSNMIRPINPAYGRYSVKCSNNGECEIVNDRGAVESSTAYGIPAVLTGSVFLSDRLTFYAAHGDLIYVVFLLCWFFLVWVLIRKR